MRGLRSTRGTSKDRTSREAPGRKGDEKKKKQKEAPGRVATEMLSSKKGAKDNSTRRARSRSLSKEKSRGKSIEKKAASLHSRKSSYSRKANASIEPLLSGGESTPKRYTEKPVSTSSARFEARKTYQPPNSMSADSIDDNIDKYLLLSKKEKNESARMPLSYAVSVNQRPPVQLPKAIQPPAVRQDTNVRATVSEMTTQSYDESEYTELQPPSQATAVRRDVVYATSTVDSERFLEEDRTYSEDESVVMKQKIAILCIAVSALQLALLLIQLILCGVASVDVNPMIGPFPDAFSEWGGKNAYLMIEGKQYFRIITPVLLHVGVLHLLVNVFCQLETCAYFEREWGSWRWLFFYIISGIGCVATSSVVNPDAIGVCSSGALMGLFGAKIAQVISWSCFEIQQNVQVHLDQLGGVMCSAAIISILSCFTYIDLAGHMGGLGAGFLAGMFVFSNQIESTCIRILWGGTGLLGLLGASGLVGYLLLFETYADPELGDACSYFRNLYPEGYDCECVWN